MDQVAFCSVRIFLRIYGLKFQKTYFAERLLLRSFFLEKSEILDVSNTLNLLRDRGYLTYITMILERGIQVVSS